MEYPEILLAPYPKTFVYKEGKYLFQNNLCICIPEKEKKGLFFTAERFKSILKTELKLNADILIGNPYSGKRAVRFARDINLDEEEYKIDVDPENIVISYGGCSGAFYSVSTFKQILRQFGKLIPCFNISDRPEFKARGIMLDISRDKIPSMDTIYKFIDFMADMKYNQLQFYVEGFSFAYPSFTEVWKDETPITGEEIMLIDRYCSDRFIELVPNQNSFGHMGHWLARKEFRDLAESPDGCELPWAPEIKIGPTTLNPLDPRSLELVEKMMSDMLPYFNSGFLNIGCDETFELGKGRSAELCEKNGVGRVYLDFLLKICGIAKKYGKRVMFWGDIILNHPELIQELPEDIIALEWGYEHNHPFEEEGRKFKDAGIQFYVCPGTSSWGSIAGRTENMKANLLNAAVNGIKNGASGYLVTDWGDNGHYQYLPVSYAGFAYAAGLSWNVDNNAGMDIGAVLDKFVFMDDRNISGKCFLDLGDYYKKEPVPTVNGTKFGTILAYGLSSTNMLKGFDSDSFDSIIAYVEELTRLFDKNEMKCEDAGLIAAEFKNSARYIIHLARAAKYQLLINNGVSDTDLLKEVCESLTDDITGIMKEHKRLWLSRNRIGGLDRSISVFEKLKKNYLNYQENKF